MYGIDIIYEKKDGKKETHDNICIKNCQQIDRDRKNCGHKFAQKRKKRMVKRKLDRGRLKVEIVAKRRNQNENIDCDC